MVHGIEKFREFFAGFEDKYVIIGGTACEVHEVNYAQRPRATKDIDIILIVEVLSSGFVARFWDFVLAAGYGKRNIGTGNDAEHGHEYYRFKEPVNEDFPYQVELFSRNKGLINFPADAHIVPIPVDDDLSSLSAILMNDDYYHFTIGHSSVNNEDGVRIANIESLICLKCKAFLEMTGRRNRGEQVDGKHILKHKKDVFRLAAMLAPAETYRLPRSLQDDIAEFIESVRDELPNADFFRAAGLKNITGEQLVGQLKRSFELQ